MWALDFIFQGIGHFLGTIILIYLCFAGTKSVVLAIRGVDDDQCCEGCSEHEKGVLKR